MMDIIQFALNAGKLHRAAQIVRTPPRDIPSVAKHAAINFGTSLFAAIGLFAANQIFMPGSPLGIAVSVLAALVSIAIISIFGFFVNFWADGGHDLHGSGSDSSSLTNRWATYLFVSFILAIMIFIFVNSGLMSFDFSLLDYLTNRFETSSGTVVLWMTLASAGLGTSIIVLKCLWFRQIQRGRAWRIVGAFFVGSIINGVLFRYLAFPSLV